jgi:hypothetical protein
MLTPVEHKAEVPQLDIPTGILYGSTSRFVNHYAPAVTRTILPAEVLPAETVTVTVQPVTTLNFVQQVRATGVAAGWRCQASQWLEQLRGKPLDLGQRLAYDARWLSTDNVAHVLQHHVSSLALAKLKLGLRPGDCIVVLQKNAPALGRRLFETLGFETVETYRPVRGTFVRILQANPYEPYRLLHLVSTLAPPNIKPGSANKVYIPRRGTRRIVNQHEIDAIAAEAGFEKVYMEDLSVPDQFGLMRSCGTLLAIHGAALGYLCMRSPALGSPPLSLIEIFSPGLVVDVYRRTAAALNGHWRGICGTVDSSFVKTVQESRTPKSAAFRDFHLDPAALTACLTEKIDLWTRSKRDSLCV